MMAMEGLVGVGSGILGGWGCLFGVFGGGGRGKARMVGWVDGWGFERNRNEVRRSSLRSGPRGN